MPYSAVTQPRPSCGANRDALLDGGVAEDAGVAGLHEDGAFGHGDVVGGDADGAEGVGGAVVGAEELRGGCCSGYGHGGIIVVRILLCFAGRRDRRSLSPLGECSKMGLVPQWDSRTECGVCWGFCEMA